MFLYVGFEGAWVGRACRDLWLGDPVLAAVTPKVLLALASSFNGTAAAGVRFPP